MGEIRDLLRLLWKLPRHPSQKEYLWARRCHILGIDRQSSAPHACKLSPIGLLTTSKFIPVSAESPGFSHTGRLVVKGAGERQSREGIVGRCIIFLHLVKRQATPAPHRISLREPRYLSNASALSTGSSLHHGVPGFNGPWQELHSALGRHFKGRRAAQDEAKDFASRSLAQGTEELELGQIVRPASLFLSIDRQHAVRRLPLHCSLSVTWSVARRRSRTFHECRLVSDVLLDASSFALSVPPAKGAMRALYSP